MTPAPRSRDGVPSYIRIALGLRCSDRTCRCQEVGMFETGLTHCPGHPDTVPSLSILRRSGWLRPLVHCFAGCTQRAVIEALHTRGLWP
jgi:hypothetical protein